LYYSRQYESSHRGVPRRAQHGPTVFPCPRIRVLCIGERGQVPGSSGRSRGRPRR
jgi:hypothetical protein